MPDYRLENAIADLDAVYVENEEDRKTLSGVNRAIERLRNSPSVSAWEGISDRQCHSFLA